MPIYASPKALYIHVPFCNTRCNYCDFFSEVRRAHNFYSQRDVILAILTRLDYFFKIFPDAQFETVFIGGGTPNALVFELFSLLINGIAQRLKVQPLEWTVEMNPEFITVDQLELMKSTAPHVTRLSIGVQSLDDKTLTQLERHASLENVLTAFKLLQNYRADFRLSADLIAGLERRTSLATEARTLLHLGIEHISVYDLTIEKGTRLEKLVQKKLFPTVSEEFLIHERQQFETVLSEYGFIQYEVSNYARPKAMSLHNLNYWYLNSYVGIGPSAVSSLISYSNIKSKFPSHVLRISETRSLSDYKAGKAAQCAKKEIVQKKDAIFDVIMMSMRTIYGLDLDEFQKRFSSTLVDCIPKTLERWQKFFVEVAPLWPAAIAAQSGKCLAFNADGLNIMDRFLIEVSQELDEGEF